MLFQKPPPDFKPVCEVVSCFVQHDGRFLLLFRYDTDGENDRWGLPAGKIDPGETPEQAVVRETLEETGIDLRKTGFHFFRKVYPRYPDYDFVFHMFYTDLESRPPVKLNPREHSGFCWFTPGDALKAPLVRELPACLELFFSR